jgi:hypothetical protein
MFSADLSWTDPDTEKVGQRKERIAKERPLSSSTQSIRSSSSSKSSVLDDKELWWPTSLKKAKNVIPSRGPRPVTGRSNHPKKPSISVPLPIDPTNQEVRDPSLQPSWIYSTIHTTLPSGASLDPPEYEVSELEADLSSRRTGSSDSHSSSKGSMKSQLTVTRLTEQQMNARGNGSPWARSK